MTRFYLFIDFDGVLCDSQLECLASSWYGYHILYKGENPAAVRLETKRRFAALRPYVRTGGDYLIIQEIIEKKIEITSQEGFDSYLNSAEKSSGTGLYAKHFYEARAHMLKSYAASWIKLNPLYAHVRSGLRRWAGCDRFYILSTKQPAYIARILKSEHINMPLKRILHSPGRGKLEIIRRHLQADIGSRAVLVDDQLDHLIGNRESRITPFLASWGYVRPEWLTGNHGVEILSPERFLQLMNDSLPFPGKPRLH